ncbi:TRAP transporter substrate-binding protein DctP [Sphaerochaeta globosa]|uniref:TRAP dicarboxylate transporter, DctP subunit n=1 Tax=Sphaerochaeta globosa (strain ATCC BAA-1886 / DSM 22777 / Buddy) TaxID=158189 RepID=F0RT26_SPHGB|nr:TRAP transporter substrate-binding protein DctP [Sphaerochaeta globosa]ADY14479.1 TRAP dicarboxylate transporter, DctP subunit [Sphaerochaeta globosa str. Buddy]
MKKILIMVLVALVATVGVFASGASESGTAAAPKKVVVAHTGNERTTYQTGMLAFKSELESLTNGRFVCEIYPATLGGDKVLMEGLQIGTVDFAEVNTSVVTSIVPELSVLDLPYLFASSEHVYKVLDGEIGAQMLALVQAKAGIVPVAYWENGFRYFTNDVRPITKPDDLKGIKMRSMQSATHLASYRLWGADATPMSISEMITAMQQGVIQGHDNNADTVVANSMWEYQDYFSESGHFYGSKVLAFSPSFWKSLSSEDQKLFVQAVNYARDIQRKEVSVRFEKSIQTLQENGMNVTRKKDIDTDAFIKSVQPVWDEYKNKYGDELIKKIESAR